MCFVENIHLFRILDADGLGLGKERDTAKCVAALLLSEDSYVCVLSALMVIKTALLPWH